MENGTREGAVRVRKIGPPQGSHRTHSDNEKVDYDDRLYPVNFGHRHPFPVTLHDSLFRFKMRARSRTLFFFSHNSPEPLIERLNVTKTTQRKQQLQRCYSQGFFCLPSFLRTYHFNKTKPRVWDSLVS